MRPELLEMSGFFAFRDPTTVDFEGADLFALTGPTGSGKSSVIDAMVFALYGSVPRIGRRDVAPIISLGKLEARVSFRFLLGDDRYTAARVVRRTRTGATTPEARLERDGDTLAGTADEVTAAVESLLGLGFDHFTKSVVLPQGEFAAFLNDPPRERQRLLRELLDLGVYGAMREAANQKRASAEADVAASSQRLDELGFATPEAGRAAALRLADLTKLRDVIDAAEPRLEVHRRSATDLDEAARRARADAAALEGLEVPAGVAELAAGLAASRDAAASARRAVGSVRERRAEAERVLAALPEAAALEILVSGHNSLSEERRKLARLQADLEEAAGAAHSAAVRAGEAEDAERSARADRERLVYEHSAHALAATLTVGEACPVCRQPVAELPVRRPPAGLAGADEALAAAAAERVEASDGAARARRVEDDLRGRMDEVAGRIHRLAQDLAGRPTASEAAGLHERVAEAQARVDELRSEESDAQHAAETSVAHLEQTENETDEARRHFDRTRDRLARLEPPVPARADLGADWDALASWAGARKAELSAAAAQADAGADRARRDLAEAMGDLAEAMAAHGLVANERSMRDVCVEAVASAAREVERIEEASERAGALRIRIDDGRLEAETARVLARHLSAAGFEAWLLEEALAGLVSGANHFLVDLSDGAYSLGLVKRDFEVVDHRNADQRRPVRTLSGGETFLVSLALALALAEELASMSVHGAAHLESLFLDEGFGTLDGETLETVASVIQELGARGRTVGIVTHVRELAEQVPVQFVVGKGPRSSTVEKVVG